MWGALNTHNRGNAMQRLWVVDRKCNEHNFGHRVVKMSYALSFQFIWGKKRGGGFLMVGTIHVIFWITPTKKLDVEGK